MRLCTRPALMMSEGVPPENDRLLVRVRGVITPLGLDRKGCTLGESAMVGASQRSICLINGWNWVRSSLLAISVCAPPAWKQLAWLARSALFHGSLPFVELLSNTSWSQLIKT